MLPVPRTRGFGGRGLLAGRPLEREADCDPGDLSGLHARRPRRAFAAIGEVRTRCAQPFWPRRLRASPYLSGPWSCVAWRGCM